MVMLVFYKGREGQEAERRVRERAFEECQEGREGEIASFFFHFLIMNEMMTA